ncbi:MAG: 3-phosphoshikimate 1-carboxyvinyltransferase [Firmicutes bacterium]|nr:3-phosphoshikimate 1-carboxyvinyltransferase [Bacillota bacterium]
MIKEIKAKESVNATINIPGDKSISHRSVMFGAIAKGDTHISGFLTGEDCLSTIDCFKKLGVEIEVNGTDVLVHGKGLKGLQEPKERLYVGNSGTTIRLISGILSAQPFNCELTGDASICKRPMKRIITPLSKMGAKIKGIENDGFAPLRIEGTKLKGIRYDSPVASAQVKSSVLLASLYAEGETQITEPALSRNHSEIMLDYFGADIRTENGVIISRPVKELYAKDINVPGDISSAAFFMVAGLIRKDSHIIIKNVGINPTRTGIIDALKEMNGKINVLNERTSGGEAVADIEVFSSELKAAEIGGDIIPRLIDEIPVLAVAAIFAEGKTIIKNAQELKVKESNRIAVMKEELSKMGADIEETDDGMIINGGTALHGAAIDSHKDHRVAMSAAVAALAAEGVTKIEDAECVSISFPDFYDILEKL